jgi:hypothetical protein
MSIKTRLFKLGLRVVLILGVHNMKYLRLLVRLGFHGTSHTKKEDQILAWMHDNGIGA